MLVDDLSRTDLVSALGTQWRAVSDRVMGGISTATLRYEEHAGHRCLHLSGQVRLEHDGGFIQMALDLDTNEGYLDASQFQGLRLLTKGNAERYSVHLRTADVTRPWQSYRAEFQAQSTWTQVLLPFSSFAPHRLDTPLDLKRLRRIGLVGIGRAFFVDLRLAHIEFYR